MVDTRETWRIDRAGSLSRLTLRTESIPDPAPGEARVSVKAVGLNFADIFACLGLYSATPKGSFVPGLEFAGVVEDLRPSTNGARVYPQADRPGLQPGDRVVGLTRFGAYATKVNVRTEFLRPIRAAWDFAEAAAYPVQGLTAWYGLVRLGSVEAGQVVLLQSAAGGVGLQSLAILSALGATTIAAVGNETKRRWLVEHRGIPPDRIIVRDRHSFGRQLDRALSAVGARGFDLIFDAVAGPFLRPAYARLRPQGRLVVYGAADYMPRGTRPNLLRLVPRYLRRFRPDPLAMMSENRAVLGFNLIWLWDRADLLPGAWDALERLSPAPPLVGRSFAFREAPAAMRHLQSGGSVGKVVLSA